MMKHKYSPELFLLETKQYNMETSNNNWINSFFWKVILSINIWLFLIANANMQDLCNCIVIMCMISCFRCNKVLSFLNAVDEIELKAHSQVWDSFGHLKAL